MEKIKHLLDGKEVVIILDRHQGISCVVFKRFLREKTIHIVTVT